MTLLQLGTSRIEQAPSVCVRKKLVVYTAEFNVVMGVYRYLPFSTGLLRAYALTSSIIQDNVRFMPFLYEMDTVKGVWSKITEPPDIFAFSLSMWNEQLSLAVAKSVKEVYGDSVLIIFGGCHVPHHPTEYMNKHPFIDVCVRSEGEEAFLDILHRCVEGASFGCVPDVSYRVDGRVQDNLEHRSYQKDMDCYPSPYMTGLFDDLMASREEGSRMFQAIIESNRGCPFDCSFCLSADTVVMTPHGEKKIDEVNAGDYVLGWDNSTGESVWNNVETPLYMGRRLTLRVATKGGFNVRTTSDHRIYTHRGWIEAGTLRIGDKVLSSLRSIHRPSSTSKEVLLQEVRVQTRLSGHGEGQSYEEERGCREAGRDAEENLQEGGSHTFHVYSRGSKGHERGSQEEAIWTRQSNEACGNTRENGEHSEREALQDVVRTNEEKQPHEQPRDEGEICELVERSRYYEEISGGDGRGIRCSSKQVREENTCVLGEEQSPVQVCRGLNLLAGSVPVRDVPKSRLHSYNQGSEEDHTCAWKEMAQRSEGSEERDQRLQQQGVEVLDYLGRRRSGYEAGEEDHEVCWEEIVSIEEGEEEDVYDLANLEPFPNFFANGVLVHNCYWAAGGLMTKYRFHSLEYTKDELTWAGRNKIPYLFMADSNFAMHPRDKEIAEHAVKVKTDLGYPDKLRVCWGKNTDEKVYQVAGILHQANLEKGITLARQSNDPTTLKNIRRDNIKLATYQNLQKRFTDINVPTYTELILGLPGETTESWKSGIDEILTSSGLKANLFIYLAQVLPNTELWRSEYRKQHGIRTRMVELTEIHGSKRSEEWIKEYEEIVIGTNTMPYRQWRDMCKFSWMTMLLHSMKAGFFVMGWLWDRFKIPPSEFITAVIRLDIIGQSRGVISRELGLWDELLDRVSIFGESRGQLLDGYGDVYWDVEEAALLRMSEDWDAFYEDLELITTQLLYANDDKTSGLSYSFITEMECVFLYQRMRMPYPELREPWVRRVLFLNNVPEYFDGLHSSSPVALNGEDQVMKISPKDFKGDKERFARETILWGRKSGTMLIPCEWESVP